MVTDERAEATSKKKKKRSDTEKFTGGRFYLKMNLTLTLFQSAREAASAW